MRRVQKSKGCMCTHTGNEEVLVGLGGIAVGVMLSSSGGLRDVCRFSKLIEQQTDGGGKGRAEHQKAGRCMKPHGSERLLCGGRVHGMAVCASLEAPSWRYKGRAVWYRWIS